MKTKTKMKKSHYQNSVDCIKSSIINLEDGLCWLNSGHKDRERIHEIIDEMSRLIEDYKLEILKLESLEVKK
jgi:hypothetical protein